MGLVRLGGLVCGKYGRDMCETMVIGRRRGGLATACFEIPILL